MAQLAALFTTGAGAGGAGAGAAGIGAGTALTAGEAASSLGTLAAPTAAQGLGGSLGSLGVNFGAGAAAPTAGIGTIPATTGITAGAAPSAFGGGGWLDSLTNGAQNLADNKYVQGGTQLAQGMKPPQIPPAQVNPNAGQNLGGGKQGQSAEDQMNAILGSIFGLRQ